MRASTAQGAIRFIFRIPLVMNDNEVSAFNVGHVSSNAVFPAVGRPVYLLLALAGPRLDS